MIEEKNQEARPKKPDNIPRSKPVRWLLVFCGILSLGLGILGIVTPLLPTTPFLLLSAACFYRGSERLHNWLLNHTIFGKYITNYIENQAIPGRMKIKTVSLLWITIGTTAIFFVDSLTIRIILLIIAVLVTLHLLRLKSLSD
jgi:uncharacterized membrane protein YbaN (DUF454 family)